MFPQEWQHHARASFTTPETLTLTYFNNRNSGSDNGTHPSAALTLSLDITTRSASVVQSLLDPSEPLYTVSQGAHNVLSNGNSLVAFGGIPVIKELGPGSSSDVRMTLRFGANDAAQSYRAYRQSWTAMPATAPAVVASKEKGAFMSWNGATEYDRWVVYAGTSQQGLTKVGSVERDGFETSFNLAAGMEFVQVGAFKGEEELRNSSVVSVL